MRRPKVLPDYQPTVGLAEQEMLAPGLALGARVACFGVRADAEAITRFADGFLGRPTDGAFTYRALAPLVLVLFQDVERLTSEHEDVGYIPDREAAVAVLLWEWQRGLHLPRPVLWMPFVLIDNAIGLVTGLNVWGFRKELSRIALPQPGERSSYRADALLFRTLSRETRGEVTTLLEVEGDAPAPGASAGAPPAELWTWLLERVVREAGPLGGLLGRGVEGLAPLLRQHFRLRTPVVNLKQFRDAADGRKACYQSLVRSDVELLRLRAAGRLEGDYRLHLTPCESHRIAESLGLPQHRDIPVSFGLWLEGDCRANPGREVWRADT